MNINLNLYKYFYVVAKYESYTKASEELFVSQPSLSYSIKTLETQLGYILFERNNNKIILTSKGKDLYEKVVKMIDLINEMEDDSVKGNIVIGVMPLYDSEVLPYYLQVINSLYPYLTVKNKIRTPEELNEELNEGKIDLIINYDFLSSDKYVSEKVKENTLGTCLVVGEKFADKYKDFSLDKISNNKVLVVPENLYSQKMKEKYPQFHYESVFSTPVLYNKLMTEDCIGLAPELLSKEKEKEGTVKIINTNFNLPKIEFYVSYLKRNENNINKEIFNIFTNYSLDDIKKLFVKEESK